MSDPLMPDDPIDLTALDPDADPRNAERFVNAVMTRIAATPNLYPVRVDVLWGAWSLARPVLVAASIAIVAAGIAISRASNDAPRGPLTVAESVGVPPVFGVVTAPAAAPRGGQSR
jgi:hypothetical protein